MQTVDFLGRSRDSIVTSGTPTQITNMIAEPVPIYSSVINVLQQIVLQRQVEFQNWLNDYLGIHNPTIKLIISMAIFHPTQMYSDSKTAFIRIYSIVKNFILFLIYSFYRKPVPKKISLTIPSINEGSINHMYVALDWYLTTNCKVKVDQDNIIVSIKRPIEGTKEEKTYQLLIGQPEEKITEIDYKGCTISYQKDSKVEKIYTPTGEVQKRNYYINLWSYECTRKSLEELCQYVANQYAKSKIEEVWYQRMYTHNTNQWNSSVIDRNKRRVETVVLKNDINKKILDDLTHFEQTEDWHLDRGIPYKKSYLFYGPPGTGKSSMIKAISYEIKRHIHYLNLATIRNDTELAHLMSNINFKETIIIIEDIDAMSEISWDRKLKQENIQPDDKALEKEQSKDERQKETITLSGLLNQIDGLHNNHGMILVMTTNHPEKLDQALIRDGRVDDRVYFGYCDHEQIYKMFVNFYNGSLKTTLEEIKTLDLNKYKIAPCNVENAMKKNYKDCTEAFKLLQEIKETSNIDFSDMNS